MSWKTFWLLFYIWHSKERSLTQIELYCGVDCLANKRFTYLNENKFVESIRNEGDEIYMATTDKGAGFIYGITAATVLAFANLVKALVQS